MSTDAVRAELARVADVLMPGRVPWAVAAGAAVFLYAGSRTPTDVDLMVPPEDLSRVGEALGVAPETKRTSWGEVTRIQVGDVEIAAALTVRAGSGSYPYRMDAEMWGRVRRVTFHGLELPVLAPEDLVALKAVLQRGPEQGKHDLEDVAALAASVRIDPGYLRFRLERMGAVERARDALREWEWGRGL